MSRSHSPGTALPKNEALSNESGCGWWIDFLDRPAPDAELPLGKCTVFPRWKYWLFATAHFNLQGVTTEANCRGSFTVIVRSH